MRKIDFVSYEGKHPNFCSGKLTLRIDDKVYVTEHAIRPSIPFFVVHPDDYYSPEKYPTCENFWDMEIWLYMDEVEHIRALINNNIQQHRCCGGCS